MSPSRNPVSFDRAYATIVEREPDGCGGVADTTTIFLTASECPIGCSMCDLWQNTLPTATPTGAIVRQIQAALAERIERKQTDWIKLYNSGNFFDPRSIPPQDYESIAQQCEGFSRVIVENHPRFGAKRMESFRDLLDGRLEVAVGLETVQPRWLGRLDKKMSRDEFDRFAARLNSIDVDLRVFVIVGVPGISTEEAMRWARLSVRHASRVGARHVSLIPARSGHGWNGRASELPDLDIADLYLLHQQALRDVDGACCVTVDLWDIDNQVSEDDERQVSKLVHQANVCQSFATEAIAREV